MEHQTPPESKTPEQKPGQNKAAGAERAERTEKAERTEGTRARIAWNPRSTLLKTGRLEGREVWLCYLAFLIPAAALLWVYASVGMAPWGDKTVLISDMKDQYAEFFCALKQGDLFFSWSKALGTSYIGVFSYYVSSPLSFLTLLFPNSQMPLALLILTVLKIGLAGASCCLYFQRRFPGSGLAALVSGIAWGLMSYNAAYSLCIMWLDGVIWLPLILLALDRILDGRGMGPFAAALTVCFLSNWYISYMVGGFCLLYFCVGCGLRRLAGARLWTALRRFVLGAVCALCLTAWMWLPTFLAMFNGKFSGGNVEYSGLLTAELKELLPRLWDGSYTSITYSALPYVYCGIAALGLSLVYLCQRHPWQERVLWAALAVAMGASVALSPLDKIWHLLQKPNWFPWRYAFLVSFCLLLMSAQAVPLIMQFLREHASPWTPRVVSVLLTVFVSADLTMNTQNILMGLDGTFRYQSQEAWTSDVGANELLVGLAKEDCGDVFWRMGAYTDLGHNGPLAFGYAGITHYSSLYNYDVNELLRKLGFAQTWMWCASYGSTPVTDAILDLRYELADSAPYESLGASGAYVLYRNPNVLPLAFFGLGEETPELLEWGSAFQVQNQLLRDIAGTEEDVFAPVLAWEVQPEDDASIYETELTFTGTGKPVYADLDSSALRGVSSSFGVPVRLGLTEEASIHYLGTPAEGEQVSVWVQHNGSWAPGSEFLWELDMDGLADAVAQANAAAPEVLSVQQNGTAQFRVSPDGDRIMLTTIPAENGWRAEVDGQQVDTGTWLDTFLTVPVPQGEHQVVLRYTAPGLVPGACLGILAAAALAGTALWRRKSRGTGGGQAAAE